MPPPVARPVRLHSRVAVAKFGYGTVLFVGQTSFATGVWVGIALDPGEGEGKNDGSVAGKRYFEAEPGRGIFVRPTQIEVLPEEEYEEEEEEEEAPEDVSVEPYTFEQEQAGGSRGGDLFNEASPPATMLRGPPSTPQVRTTASGASTASSSLRRLPSTESRNSMPSIGRSSSPDKSTMRPPSRPASRPSLVSRSSIASSVASSVGTAPASRRSVASSPSKSAARSRASPAKPASATPASRSTAPLRPVTSGRASVASAARPSAPVRPVAPRSATGGTSSGTTGRPTPSTSVTRATPVSQSRPGSRPVVSSSATSAGPDAQSASARAGLRPVTKARSSMMAPALSRGDSATSGRAQMLSRRSSADTSDQATPTARGFDHADLSLSPSAEARQRLSAARAKAESQHHPPTHDMQLYSEDDDDLVGTALPDGMTDLQGPAAIVSAAQSQELAALKREVEELRVRNRLNEKRRDEERIRAKELESWKEEVAEKLKTSDSTMEKAQKLSAEVLSLQTTERELVILKSELEERVEELSEQLEMAALDREVAEEKAEAAASDLQEIKQLNEELTLELDLLREENKAYEHGDVDVEQSSTAWIHLQKQNERLKEALLKLRDVTTETDFEQRRKISELEKELDSLADVQDSRDALAAKLQANEAQLDDVKTQLDDALGAEEMVEQLTERNLFLGERMNELTAGIEELEALKELNEELEEIHLETERQLQEEVDLKEVAIREWEARCQALETNAVDYEATFSQFRELVLNLQNDLEVLRAERDGLLEDGQNAASLNSQSREMLSLNMKLQSRALKSQARSIENDLGRMKYEQATLQLEMLMPYLPPPFAEEGDRDALSGLLFFQRMSSKADLIRSSIESKHDITQALGSLSSDVTTVGEDGVLTSTHKVPEHLVTVCQLRHSLAHFSAVCSSVVAMLRLAPPKVFLKCGRMFKEVQAAVEGRVDAFVEALRREELKENDCNADFKRIVRQFEDLSYALMMSQEEEIQALHEQAETRGCIELLPTYGDGDLAAKEVGSATLLDLDLDTLSASLCSAQGLLARENIAWQLQGKTVQGDYLQPLDRLFGDVKAAKLLAKKLLRRLSSLASNDEAVSMAAIGNLPSLGRLSSKLVAFATTLESAVLTYLNETKAAASPFVLTDLLTVVKAAARELSTTDTEEEAGTSAVEKDEPWQEAIAATAHLTATINGLVLGATEQDNVIKISGVAPWEPRSKAVHEVASHNVELERQALRLQDDLRDLYQQIKARDSALQEGAIKLERLNKKLEKSKGQDEEIEEAKARLNEARQQAKAYQDANGVLQAELEALEKVKEALDAQIAANKARDGGKESIKPGSTAGGGSTSEYSLLPAASVLPASHLETHYLLDQLDAMRGVLKYLREENALLLSAGWTAESCGLAPLVHDLKVDVETAGGPTDPVLQAEVTLTGLPHKAKRAGPAADELRTVARERKSLYSSLLQLSASPKVVVLPPVPAIADMSESVKDAQTPTDPRRDPGAPAVVARRVRPWQPASKLPSRQYEAQQARVEDLSLRFQRLVERSRPVGGALDVSGSLPLSLRAKTLQMPVVKSLMT